MENKKGLIFTLVCIAGFVLIVIFVPRLVDLITAWRGGGPSKALRYLGVALFWYIWAEICVRIKNRNGID